MAGSLVCPPQHPLLDRLGDSIHLTSYQAPCVASRRHRTRLAGGTSWRVKSRRNSSTSKAHTSPARRRCFLQPHGLASSSSSSPTRNGSSETPSYTTPQLATTSSASVATSSSRSDASQRLTPMTSQMTADTSSRLISTPRRTTRRKSNATGSSPSRPRSAHAFGKPSFGLAGDTLPSALGNACPRAAAVQRPGDSQRQSGKLYIFGPRSLLACRRWNAR